MDKVKRIGKPSVLSSVFRDDAFLRVCVIVGPLVSRGATRSTRVIGGSSAFLLQQLVRPTIREDVAAVRRPQIGATRRSFSLPALVVSLTQHLRSDEDISVAPFDLAHHAGRVGDYLPERRVEV